MVDLPKYLGVRRKSGSYVAEASGGCYLETQPAWRHMGVNGLF